jgi:PKD repeat protein
MPGENVLFSDLSTGGPTSWEWTFEGGNPATSTVKNPTISYPTEGVFSVSLKVKNNAGENEVTKNQYITVGQSSVQNEGDIVLSKLYPNPVATNERVNIHFTIKKAGVYYCDILDNNGRVIKSIWKDKIKSGENVMEFNTSHLSSGTYYFNIRNVDGKQLTLPFVVW